MKVSWRLDGDDRLAGVGLDWQAFALALTFTYRCDGPAECRRMQATVTADRHSGIEIFSDIAATRSRAPVLVLDHRITGRVDEQIRMCSWCARVLADAWVDIEEACRRLGLLEATGLPTITHGICPHCIDSLTVDLDVSPGLLPHNRRHISSTPAPGDTLRIVQQSR